MISQAFSASAPPPSGATVSALADVLALDTDYLLALLDVATGAETDRSTPPGAGSGGDVVTLGRPIAEWDPDELEVHPAVDAPSSESSSGHRLSARLPKYVFRTHDEELSALVSEVDMGQSRMAVLVGTSSTGKTRACWEAVQPLASKGWRLWHPFDPTRAEAAFRGIEGVGPRTVVWLNEAQHYFGASGGLGERISSAVHTLLTTPRRGPILILGTMWPEYADTYIALPQPGEVDRYSHARAVLSGRLIGIPESFDTKAAGHAQALAIAGDAQLAHALEHVQDGRVTQFLAGAPELVRRYESASSAARALLHAAMDARRLGVGVQLPIGFLEHAAEGYLSDDEFDDLDDNWLEQALMETSRPVHGKLAPLRRSRRRIHEIVPPTQASPSSLNYRLADYLEQRGRRERRLLCPPTSFWQAAHDYLSAADLVQLANEARLRYRNRWSYILLQRAVESGYIPAVRELAFFLENLNPERSSRLYEQAIESGDTHAMILVAQSRDIYGDIAGADELWWQAADSGDEEAIEVLPQRLDAYGVAKGIEQLLQKNTAAGNVQQRELLSEWRSLVEELESEDFQARHPEYGGEADALALLAQWRDQVGDSRGAESLRQVSAAVVDPVHEALVSRSGDGFIEGAISQAGEAGETEVQGLLIELEGRNGDYRGVERTLLKLLDSGNPKSPSVLFLDDDDLWPNYINFWPYGLEADGSQSAPWW